MGSDRRGIVGIAALGAAIAVALATVAFAETVSLKNPGFETGTFKAWNVIEDGGGNWLVYRKGDTPPDPELRQGIVGPLTEFPDPPRGQRAAFQIQDSPGLNILHRVLRPRKDAETNKLRLFLYYSNTAEQFNSPNHFEFGDLPSRGMGEDQANQQVRIDLLKRRAPVRSLANRHVLATLLRTRAGDPLKRPYKKLGANLTKLGIDKPFRLRIAEVDNQAPLYVGVDGLKLKFKR